MTERFSVKSVDYKILINSIQSVLLEPDCLRLPTVPDFCCCYAHIFRKYLLHLFDNAYNKVLRDRFKDKGGSGK